MLLHELPKIVYENLLADVKKSSIGIRERNFIKNNQKLLALEQELQTSNSAKVIWITSTQKQ